MTGLQIETQDQADGVTVVRLIGAADLSGAATLERAIMLLSARRPARVVFDMTRLSILSSLCIGALVSYRRACADWHSEVVLAGATGPVEAALLRCRLDQLFTIAPSLESALAS
jgi:anti-anti-sigma factor